MSRLKPSTSRAIDDIGSSLHAIAEELEKARPFLADLYRRLATELSDAVRIPDAPFNLSVPPNARIEVSGDRITIYPKDFDEATYWRRLTKAVSRN